MGEFQSKFVDSWKVASSSAEALFTRAECPSGPSYSGPPPEPFDNCPQLRVQAEEQCPKGKVHAGCIADVGITCDLKRMVAAAKEADRERNDAVAKNVPRDTTTFDAPTLPSM